MLPTTLDVIKAGLKSDPSVSPADRKRILALLHAGAQLPKAGSSPPPEIRIARRAEAAHRLGCSLRLVDRLAKDGILPKIYLPNRQRAAGFLESDLVALLNP